VARPRHRRAAIWITRGQIRDALATVDAARLVLAGPGLVLPARLI
jgi:hypothetical protein